MVKTNEFSKLRKLAQKVLTNANYAITPKHPYCIVWELPKETKIGSIYIPEKGQNKPVWEGLVLKTYGSKLIDGKEILPCVEVGDHVLYQHHLGVPIPGLDGGTGEFRLIEEQHFIMVLENQQESVREKLIRMICNTKVDKHVEGEEYISSIIANNILDNATVVFKSTAKTLSGK